MAEEGIHGGGFRGTTPGRRPLPRDTAGATSFSLDEPPPIALDTPEGVWGVVGRLTGEDLGGLQVLVLGRRAL